jgi:hypothetical protein
MITIVGTTGDATGHLVVVIKVADDGQIVMG